MNQAHFFRQLNRDLKQHGTATPQLILDLAALAHNIWLVRSNLPDTLQPRLVVKSLASLELLQLISQQLDCQRFMLFHAAHLPIILQHFPDADILLGKPMPVRAMQLFYQNHSQYQSAKIQWLVDEQCRLHQYLTFAQAHDIKLNINIEIDVGLHRGGVSHTCQLGQLLDCIQQHPDHLQFTGLMGYDAHVTKLPKIIAPVAKSYLQSQKTYQHYQQFIQQNYPDLYTDDLCFNGAGSPSFALHCQQSVCNDIAFGSMLLKPSDFDSNLLDAFRCALWIATPVIKNLPFSQLPSLEFLNKLPHQHRALFVYGGYWLADYVYPDASRINPLYGRSSNQEMLLVPKKHCIRVDDYVFLRPQQSEAIIPQFAHLYVYEKGQFKVWTTFRE